VAARTPVLRFATWYWGDAIAIDGLLAADAAGAGAWRPQVVDTLARWHRFCPPGFDDALAPGRAILELVRDDRLGSEVAERFGDALDRLPALEGPIPALEPHRPQFRFGFCIDALYHLPSALVLLARFRADGGATRRAFDLCTNGMALLRCETGWAQWYDVARRANNQVAWSRGLGWALLGLLDLLEVTEQDVDFAADRSHIQAIASSVLEALARTQRPSGHWAAVLGAPDCPEETSTAAFYVAGSLHPQAMRLGWRDRRSLEAALQACTEAVSTEGVYRGVSGDVLPSWDPATYRTFVCEPSPWGQGAALRALAAVAAARG